jgi:hypothetical protein
MLVQARVSHLRIYIPDFQSQLLGVECAGLLLQYDDSRIHKLTDLVRCVDNCSGAPFINL